MRWDWNEFGLLEKLVYKTAYDAMTQNLVNNPFFWLKIRVISRLNLQIKEYASVNRMLQKKPKIPFWLGF